MEVIKYLVDEQRVNLDAVDQNGYSALYEAVSNRNIEVADFLRKNGATLIVPASELEKLLC